jgi:L-asparagine oxygenase
MAIVPETPTQESSNVETVTLDSNESSKIYRTALDFPGEFIYSESLHLRGQTIKESGPTKEVIAGTRLGEGLQRLKDGRTVVLIVRGLPTDPNLPPAPLDGGTPVGKKTYVSEAILLGMARNLGMPSLLLGEKKEALIHQITPVPGQENTQSNEGAVDLGFHQDLAPNPEMPNLPYHLFMPDWLILNGVQEGSGSTETFISPLDDALKYLDPNIIEILKGNRFITNPPDSFVKAVGPTEPPIHPVLVDFEEHIESAVDYSSGLRPKDPNDQEASEALESLKEALFKVRLGVKIEPGTAVAFNNRRIVHGRGAVDLDKEQLDKKRWLQRVYVMDEQRIFKVAMDDGRLAVQAVNGLLRVTQFGSAPNERILELADKS